MGETCFIDYSVAGNCENLMDSFGEICVGCNCCGRINPETKYQAQVNVLKRQLQEQIDFDYWIEGHEELQRKNQAANIEHIKREIKEVEAKIAEVANG